jgi:hypothetical protein
MKPLSFPMKKSGWKFELIERKGPVLLVRKAKTATNWGWEVVVTRLMPPGTFIAYPYEKYPSSKEWGTHGWTFLAKDEVRARAKFQSLCDARS